MSTTIWVPVARDVRLLGRTIRRGDQLAVQALYRCPGFITKAARNRIIVDAVDQFGQGAHVHLTDFALEEREALLAEFRVEDRDL